MNWRRTNKDLSELYKHSPWLYMIEWRERLERCIDHLEAGMAAAPPGMSPEETLYEVDDLRRHADSLTTLIEAMDRRARRQLKIAALRNVDGRTPEEADLFLAKADELASGRNQESS